MLFTELMHAIHPYLMKEYDVPTFTRNIIQMLCDIPEEDWYTKKDPSADKNVRDASLRKFYTRGLSKKLAKAILGRLCKDNFVDSIYTDRPDSVLEGLSKAIEPYMMNGSVDKSNVGVKLFDLFEEALKGIVDPSSENERKIQYAKTISDRTKKDYGPILIDDCKSKCSMPSCGKHLQTVNSKKQGVNDFEILLIDDKKGVTYNNIIAVCHDCFQNYAISHNKADKSALTACKRIQSESRNIRSTLDDISINKGIDLVIKNLSNAKPAELKNLVYNPVSITNKIDEDNNYFLVNEIKNNVALYYKYIENTMRNLALENKYSDELIRAQIKASYINLSLKKISPEQIFNEIAERIRRITKQDICYCYIVVSYFVQSCEVFNDITK